MMNRWHPIPILAIALVCMLGVSGTKAQEPSSSQILIDGIIQDVIERTVQAAREEVRRNTGIDPLERGYEPAGTYEPAPKDASEEVRRELYKLNEEHDRTITKLEEELERKLRKAEDEFQREAAKEDKAEKIKEKRAKLQEKVDEAYGKFEEKIASENARFDEKREKILSKARG